MGFNRRRVVGRATPAALLVAALVLSGCSVAPGGGWQPPQWSDAQGVSVQLTNAGDVVAKPVEIFGEGTDTAGLEFFQGRIRNDAAQLQLRYVEIPGAHPFNDQVQSLVRAAIARSGHEVVPEVYGVDAGLEQRGCVDGSLDWPADELLQDPRTGPTGGSGVAMTCEVVSAFGDFVGVGFRTVSNMGSSLTDTEAVLYADVAAGADAEPGGIWAEEAAETLWVSTVDQLRRDAGSLTGAEIAPPKKAQRALATAALGSASFDKDGGATFTVPAGLNSRELKRLGVGPTKKPLTVEVDEQTLERLGSPQLEAMRAQVNKPFVGMPAWKAGQATDCSIVACIAVTYDDGPGPFTDQLRETLRTQRASATFYMLGTSVEAYPDTVRGLAEDGHELGSHTMTHPDLTRMRLSAATAQVLDAKALIEEVSGVSVPTFRPPYGAVNDAVLHAVDMPAVLWSIDTNDWKKPGQEKLVKRVVDPARPGDIVLLHDIHEGSVEVADRAISELKSRGFTLVTVSGMFDGDVPAGRVFARG